MTNSISSFGMSGALTNSILRMETQLAQYQKEISTGNVSDLGNSLGAGVALDYSYGESSAMLTSITSANSLVNSRLQLTQNALSSVSSTAQSLQQALVQAQNGAGSAATLVTEAQNALGNLTSTLNTADGGAYVFAGINSGTSPVASYLATPPSAAQQAVASAFQSAFGMSQSSSNVGSITASQMQSFLSGSFANQFSPSNWSANWSQASSQPVQSQISLSQTTNTSVTANDPAFRQLAEGYTMLSDLALPSLNQSAYNTVVAAASSLIGQGVSGLTQLQASVGVMQNQVATANQTMSVQQNYFQTQISTLESADQTQASVAVNNLTTQIETAYQLTSKLQKLSLANYL